MTEHQHIEYKESWRDDYLRWICGFANAEGGMLVIGRNDAGDVVGVDHAERLLTEIPNKVRDLLGIVVPVRLREEGGRQLLEIVVEPYPTPISYRGEYHVRSGSTRQQLTGAALSAFLLRKFGRHWDGAPVPGITVADLDAEAFKRFRAHAARSKRMSADALTASNADLLDRLHLTEASMLKRAALLLFHADPERFVTGAFVKVGRFDSNAEIRYHDEVHGNLFQQVEMTVELLRTKYMYARISYEGVQRVETYPMPEAALREAVINALVHKDYAMGSPIQISVYRDKLMIWNAGQLPPNWTAERLLQKHASQPANPDIAHVFFRSGLIEAWGRGIEKIMTACRVAGVPIPKPRHDGAGLWMEFEYLPVDQITEQGAPSVTDPVADPATDPATDPVERLVIVVGLSTMAPSAIQEQLQLRHRPTFRINYLRPALERGWIEMTLPERPSSPLQQYRLTAAGRERLEEIANRRARA